MNGAKEQKWLGRTWLFFINVKKIMMKIKKIHFSIIQFCSVIDVLSICSKIKFKSFNFTIIKTNCPRFGIGKSFNLICSSIRVSNYLMVVSIGRHPLEVIHIECICNWWNVKSQCVADSVVSGIWNISCGDWEYKWSIVFTVFDVYSVTCCENMLL